MKKPGILSGLPVAVAAALVLATPAEAEKIALVVGNVDYAQLGDTPEAARVFAAERAFDRAGIATTFARDAELSELRQMLPQFMQMSNAADGQVIALSGKFATDGVETFFLPADSPDPSLLGLYRTALPLSLFLSLLHNAPSGGVLVLSPAGGVGATGPNWDWGLGPLDAPDGVAIVHGSTRNVARYLQEVVPAPNRAMNTGTAGLVVIGDLPDTPFLAGEDRAEIEALAWDLARGLDTAAAYRVYLSQHPGGTHVAEARRRLAALTAPTPQQVEASLNLTADQRRAVQRNLSLLGFDTRGIDGVFGAGTRAAIRAWQGREGLPETGFVTQAQIDRLVRQGNARRVEIRREDNAFWQATGAAGTEAGLTRYLERYPDGEHAAEARAALATFEAERRAIEQEAWQNAQSVDTIAAYQRYLSAYPEGRFAEAARDRIADLEGRREGREARAAAAAEERALHLTPVAVMLAERRLAQEGFPPGPIDGVIDEDTRRAIRGLQRARGLPVTGFLTEDTVAALLAGGLRQLLDQ